MFVGKQQARIERGVRRIGDHCRGDPPGPLATQRHAPSNRAAPVVADDGEAIHAERIGELEHVADQLVGRVSLDLLRLGRSAIAALVRRDTPIAVGQMRDLVAPGPVAFGKAMQEDQRGCIARSCIHHVQFDAARQLYPGLFHDLLPSTAFRDCAGRYG